MDLKEKLDSAQHKCFLFTGDYKQQEFENMCMQFLCKSFLRKDTTLLVLVDDKLDAYKYVERYRVLAPITFGEIVCLEKNAVDVRELLSHVDGLLTGSTDKDISYLNEAFLKRIPILPLRKKDIFSNLMISDETEKEKQKMAQLVQHSLLDKYSSNEYTYILFHQGLGETTAFFFFSKDYKERLGKKIILLCYDPSRVAFMSACPYVEKIVQISKIMYTYIALFGASKFNILNYLQEHFMPGCIEQHLNPYKYTEGIVGITKTFLGFPSEYKFKKFQFTVPKQQRYEAENKFKQLGLRQGKTVWLILDGVSNGTFIEIEDLKKLIDSIYMAGYDVVIKSHSEIISGVPVAQLFPLESAVFGEMCGNIISIPTGIPYVIGTFADTRKIKFQYLFMTSYHKNWRNSPAWWIDTLSIIKYVGNDFVSEMAKISQRFQDYFWEENEGNMYYYTDKLDDNTIKCLVENLA